MVSLNDTNQDDKAYQTQLDEKVTYLKSLFDIVASPNIDSQELSVEVFASTPTHYRMRVEFRIWHTDDDLFYAMFAPGEKYTPIRVEQFAPASTRINDLMQPLLAYIKALPVLRKKLFQIDFLTSQTGEALISLLYHRQLDEAWQVQARGLAQQLNISVIGRARKQKIVIGQDSIMETLRIQMPTNSVKHRSSKEWQNFSYQHVENAFTQPNAGVNEKMITWVVAQSQHNVSASPTAHAASNLALNATPNRTDLLELYCGNGNFTIPLAQGFNQVLATEIAKSSVAAAQHNASLNGVDNITIARLSSEEMTQALQGVRAFRRLQGVDLSRYQFSCVFVDPPRAGLDDKTLSLIQNFDKIIYMSCNPTTLIDNVTHLQTTHKLTAVALFDQFPFTHHIECGVVMQRT